MERLATFFKPVVVEEAWQNEAEKAEVKRFQALRDVLKTALCGAKEFRVGKEEVEVYGVGQANEGYEPGLRTRATNEGYERGLRWIPNPSGRNLN